MIGLIINYNIINHLCFIILMIKTRAAEIALKSAKTRKRKNFWELAYLFNDFAVGMRFIRKIWWNKPETYWTITRVIPTNPVSLLSVCRFALITNFIMLF